MSLVFVLIISIPLGMIAAVYQNKWVDYLIGGYTFLGVSIPSFWIGLIFLRIFGVNLKWVSVSGGNSTG